MNISHIVGAALFASASFVAIPANALVPGSDNLQDRQEEAARMDIARSALTGGEAAAAASDLSSLGSSELTLGYAAPSAASAQRSQAPVNNDYFRKQQEERSRLAITG